MIAGTLKGIVSQRLVPTADGAGRIACCEILVMTGRVHDMILDPKLTGELPEVIAEGSYYGMQTFDQHLLSHLQAGRVSLDDAMRVASSPHDFKLMVAASAGSPAEAPSPAGSPAPAAAEPERLAPPVHESAPPRPPVQTVVAAEQPAPAPAPAQAPAEPVGPPPSAPPPGL